MQMPARAYELMPLAVLIGGLISLSQLASGSELTVIKASGMSTKKLLLILSQFGLIFAIATVALGEWVAPTLSQKAENIKAAAINGKISTGNTGLWLKEKNSIINVREMLPDHTLLGIKIWQRNDKKRTDPSGGSRIRRFESRRQLAAEKISAAAYWAKIKSRSPLPPKKTGRFPSNAT